ncbi:ABC transporter permease, partial [Burkholderia multivorans]|nr:ABC transporter permease [Burkholderia multivorans]
MQPAARRFVCVARHSAGSRSGRREPLNTMTIASSPTSTAALKRELKAAEARKRTMALLLIAPLAIF